MGKILVVIDMQKDFVDGSLGSKEAVAIVPNVVEKVKNWDGEIYFTRDTHQPDYMQTQEGKNLPVEHCIKGTEGWEIIPELRSFAEPSMIWDKPTFGSIELARFLEEKANRGEIEAIEMVGLCTDICVVSNALLIKALMPEMPISVDASCCAGVTPQKHDAALETMRSCQVAVL